MVGPELHTLCCHASVSKAHRSCQLALQQLQSSQISSWKSPLYAGKSLKNASLRAWKLMDLQAKRLHEPPSAASYGHVIKVRRKDPSYAMGGSAFRCVSSSCIMDTGLGRPSWRSRSCRPCDSTPTPKRSKRALDGKAMDKKRSEAI